MINDVGARMLVLRKLNGWSQRQLAKRAGVPHSAISMIEHGQVSPSVNSLRKVLEGVPISLADFFALDLDSPVRVFYKHDKLAQEDATGIIRSRITTRGNEWGVNLIRETYPPGSDVFIEASDTPGEMVGYVVQGFLEISIGGEVDTLTTGDGFYFERRRPHRFVNQGVDTAQIVAALLPPPK